MQLWKLLLILVLIILICIPEADATFFTKLRDQKVKEWTNAEFSCRLDKPDAVVKWYRKGVLLVESEKYMMKTEKVIQKLIIKDCVPEDEQEYTIELPSGEKCDAKLEVVGERPLLSSSWLELACFVALAAGMLLYQTLPPTTPPSPSPDW